MKMKHYFLFAMAIALMPFLLMFFSFLAAFCAGYEFFQTVIDCANAIPGLIK